MKKHLSSVLRCLLAAGFAACVSLANVGCSQNQACPSGCTKECCAGKTAQTCPPGCTKPCCAKT